MHKTRKELDPRDSGAKLKCVSVHLRRRGAEDHTVLTRCTQHVWDWDALIFERLGTNSLDLSLCPSEQENTMIRERTDSDSDSDSDAEVHASDP